MKMMKMNEKIMTCNDNNGEWIMTDILSWHMKYEMAMNENSW